MLIAVLSLTAGLDSAGNLEQAAVLDSFAGMMFAVGLQRLVVGLDRAQDALQGIDLNRLNKILKNLRFTVPLDKTGNEGDAVRKRKQ